MNFAQRRNEKMKYEIKKALILVSLVLVFTIIIFVDIYLF